MKAAVNVVSSVVEDVRLYAQRPQRERSEVDQDMLKALREEADATLSNLVTASKTHVTSSGMSPVSLLDAAASHVSATVTEIGKMVGKHHKLSRITFLSSSLPPVPLNTATSNGFLPSLRAVEDVKPLHQKKTSSGAGSRRIDVLGSPGSRFGDSRAAAAVRITCISIVYNEQQILDI